MPGGGGEALRELFGFTLKDLKLKGVAELMVLVSGFAGVFFDVCERQSLLVGVAPVLGVHGGALDCTPCTRFK